jgi:hypothetical protein
MKHLHIKLSSAMLSTHRIRIGIEWPVLEHYDDCWHSCTELGLEPLALDVSVSQWLVWIWNSVN